MVVIWIQKDKVDTKSNSNHVKFQPNVLLFLMTLARLQLEPTLSVKHVMGIWAHANAFPISIVHPVLAEQMQIHAMLPMDVSVDQAEQNPVLVPPIDVFQEFAQVG